MSMKSSIPPPTTTSATSANCANPPTLQLLHLNFASDSSSAALDTLWLDDLLSHISTDSPAPAPAPAPHSPSTARDPLPHLDSANQAIPDSAFHPVADNDDDDTAPLDYKSHEVPSNSVSPSTSSFLFSHSLPTHSNLPHSHSTSLTEPAVVDSFLSLRPATPPRSHAGRASSSSLPPLHSKKPKSDRSASPAALFLLHRSSRLLAKLRKHFPNPAAACTSVPPDSPLLTRTATTTVVLLPPTSPTPPPTAQGSTPRSRSSDKRKSAPPALSLPPLPRHPSPATLPDSSIPPTPLAPRPKSVTTMESPNGLPRLDLSSLPYHGGHNSSDSDSSASPSSPSNGSPSKRRGSKVQFSRYIKVSYTFAAEEYDRNPVEPPAMTAKDYYEYQVMAFEMHQAIRFETTMRQLGLWDNSTPGIAQVPVVPTIPVVASTLERRKEVKATFSKGTKVVVAKPRTTSLQAQMLDLDEGLEDGLPIVALGHSAHAEDQYVHQLEAHTLALVDNDAELDEQLADYERHYAALAGANGYSSQTAAAIRT